MTLKQLLCWKHSILGSVVPLAMFFFKLSGKINDQQDGYQIQLFMLPLLCYGTQKKYWLDQRRDFCCQGNKLNMKSVYLLGKVSKSTLQCHQMSPAFPGRPFRHIKSGAKSASSTFFPSTHLHSQSRLDFEKQGKNATIFFQISKMTSQSAPPFYI